MNVRNDRADGALTEDDVAYLLGVTVGAIRQWRARGQGPVFYRFGRAVRYTRADVEEYKASRAVRPSTSPSGMEAQPA